MLSRIFQSFLHRGSVEQQSRSLADEDNMRCSRLILPRWEINTVKFRNNRLSRCLLTSIISIKESLKQAERWLELKWNACKVICGHRLMQLSALEWCFESAYNTRTRQCCGFTVFIRIQLTLNCYNRRDAVCLPNRPLNITDDAVCVFASTRAFGPFAFSWWCGECELH